MPRVQHTGRFRRLSLTLGTTGWGGTGSVFVLVVMVFGWQAISAPARNLCDDLRASLDHTNLPALSSPLGMMKAELQRLASDMTTRANE